MLTEKNAIKLASGTAFVLLVIKWITGIVTGSVAVLSSAIDSLLDFFVSLFNYIAIKTAKIPADEAFNYGRGKIEALAAFIEGLVIICSWVYIMYESVMKLINKEQITLLGPAMWIMLVSVCITTLLVFILSSVAKKTKNLVVESDLLHYKTDLYTNAGILFSLGVIAFTKFYFIDALVGMIVAVYIIYSAYEIMKKWFLLILDVAIPKDIVKKMKTIIESENYLQSYHYLKTRHSGGIYYVQGHLVFKDPRIELVKAHTISDILECKIKALDSEKQWIVDFHLDPYDDKWDDNKCTILLKDKNINS